MQLHDDMPLHVERLLGSRLHAVGELCTAALRALRAQSHCRCAPLTAGTWQWQLVDVIV